MIIEEHINDYPIKSAYFRHCYMIYNKDTTKVYIFKTSSTDARARLLLMALSPGPSKSPRRGDFGVHDNQTK